MKIWRKGKTARQWDDDPGPGKLSAKPGCYLSLRFQMPSKGGGDTDVIVQHEPNDFGKLHKAMVIVDPADYLRQVGEMLKPKDLVVLLKALGAQDEAATLRAIGEYLVARATLPTSAQPPSPAKLPTAGFQLAASPTAPQTH